MASNDSSANKRMIALQQEVIKNQRAAAEAKAAFGSRQGDIEAGRQFAQETLGPEGLGRLGGDPDIENVLQKRREFAQGLTGEEMAGQRDVATQNINQATQTQSRELRAAQARAGLRGGTAANQQMQVLAQGAQQKAEFERDLMLRNREAQIQGVGELEASATGVRKFDLAQAAAEKQAVATGALGFAQLGVAERTSKAAADAQAQSAAASSGGCFPSGTKVKMIDGTTKNIESIEIGDFIKHGGIVTMTSKHMGGQIWNYKGVEVTGSHLVLENNTWKKVEDSIEGKITDRHCIRVYNLSCTNHMMEIEGIIMSDYDGMDVDVLIKEVLNA